MINSKKIVRIEFHGKLKEFPGVRGDKSEFYYRFFGKHAVKDAIEALGVPHAEVGKILTNGEEAGFDYKIKHQDYVQVYPVNFKYSNISIPETFILDVHLGTLCKYLRMMGFDTVYDNHFDDPEIIEIAKNENRIILTRDIGILKNKQVKFGYWLRSQNSELQLEEVLNHFNLKDKIRPFTRCIACNGTIKKVDKNEIIHRLKPLTKKYFTLFFQCCNCGKIFWEGSHFENMKKIIDNNTPKA